MGMKCIGVDIGGTSVKIGLFETTGELLDKWEVKTRKEDGGVNILPDVAASIRKKLDEKGLDLKKDVAGAGMGVPGPVMPDGYVEVCVNLGWRDLNPQEELSRLLDGIPVKIIDTAGIRETEDVVEKIGVERSREKIQEADLVLLILDSSRELDDEDKEIIDSVGDKKCVVILNKIDLECKIDENVISNFENIIKISAKEEIGLSDLKETIKELFFSGKIDTESLIISNSRHKQALFRALENAEMALSKVRMNEYLDLISIFVTSALRALNEITGDELEEDLVNKIFGDFCVGK